MNDRHVNTEEEIIYEIVEDIISTENKINELNQEVVLDDNKGPGLAQFNLKHEITKNISNINTLTTQKNELNKKLDQMKMLHNLELKKIENSIKEIDNKIKNLATNGSKEELYRLSYEKIEEIISKKKSADDLLSITLEFNSIDSLKRNVNLDLENCVNVLNQLKEKLQKMKEEKVTVRENLVNLISEKESYEELLKLLGLNNKAETPEINIYHYEMCQIDIIKFSRDISEAIANFFSTSLFSSKSNNDDFSLSFSSTPGSTINIVKSQIGNIVKTEMISFINLKSLVTQYQVNSFISSLSNKILSNVSTGGLNSSKLIDFIKYIIKINYYEVVINNELNFVDKEYKTLKKEIKNQINEIGINISKLQSQKEELDLKISVMKEKEKHLISTQAKNLINLTPEEREYILLNEKTNALTEKKKKILEEFEEKESKLDFAINSIEEKIKELVEKNKKLELGIEQINTDLLMQKKVANNEIIQLRKEINEKFKMIKLQLNIFKKKHGERNMDLYNKLVDKINTTLKLTSKSSLYHHGHSNSFNKSLNSPLLLSSSNRNFPINQSMNISTTTLSPKKFEKRIERKLEKNNPFNYSQGSIVFKSRNTGDPYLQKNYRYELGKDMKTVVNRFEEQQHKLSMSIKNFKNLQKIKTTLSSNNLRLNGLSIYNNEARSHLIPMQKPVTCYYRIVNEADVKFNPLYCDSLELFGFVKISLRLNENCTYLLMKERNEHIKIDVAQIENTIVNNNIKFIIKIYQKYKHYKHTMSIDSFLKAKEIADIPLNNKDKIKALQNDKFNFQISLKSSQRVEFVMIRYEDIKMWLNGIYYLIRHKK